LTVVVVVIITIVIIIVAMIKIIHGSFACLRSQTRST